MHIWTSLTSHLGKNFKTTSKPTTATPKDKMNASVYQQNEARVQVEISPTVPSSKMISQAPTQLPPRHIDPSQTLQLPFHESLKAETPFVNPLGSESPLLLSPPHSASSSYVKLPSPSLATHSASPSGDRNEKSTWQDGWVKVIEVEKEGERGDKKRSKKEWRNDEVEPAKKKSRDYSRTAWAPRQRMEKVANHWGPNAGLRTGYI